MTKTLKGTLAIGLGAAMCFALVSAYHVRRAGGALVEAAEDGYYSSVTAASGVQLLGQLHDLITSTHTNYTNYKDYGSYVYNMDPGSETRSIREFYTHETMTTGLGGNAGQFNREHVWPKSLSNGLWQNDRGGADLHHLRPTEVKMNGVRDNDLYGEVNGGQAAYSNSGALGGYQSGGVFEPLDNVKGDAARIILYMYVHYNTYTNAVFGGYATTNGRGASNCFGALPITKVISASSESAAFDLLIKWNEEDEVDEVERLRNDYVESVQGNRNPFIDHPEYASMVWGDGDDGGDGGDDNDLGLAAFHAAVRDLDAADTFSVRREALNEAVEAYHALNETQKEEAAEDYAILQAAIQTYNDDVERWNEAAEEAADVFLRRKRGE